MIGASIVALEEASVSGTVTILGDDADALFANDGITLSGNLYVEADIVSANAVVRHGNALDIRGEIVEGADRVHVGPDLEGAERAASRNDNAALSVGGKSPIKDGELRLSGKTSLSMPAGTYAFPNGMSISGQSSIVLGGDVKIYVEGPVSITGTTHTNHASPYRLDIISVGAGDVRLAGTSDAVLHVSAPLADVSLSGTTAFDGTILGKNVKISGTADLGNAGDALLFGVDCEDPEGPSDPLPEQPS